MEAVVSAAPEPLLDDPEEGSCAEVEVSAEPAEPPLLGRLLDALVEPLEPVLMEEALSELAPICC